MPIVATDRSILPPQLNRAVQKREEELKEQLYIQTEAHSQHLSEALQSQAEQLDARWAKQLDLKLNEQESYYQVELVKALARLQGIEAVVDTIANAGIIMGQRWGKGQHTCMILLYFTVASSKKNEPLHNDDWQSRMS